MTLEARSLLFSFISAMFSLPASEKFALLRQPEMKDKVMTACDLASALLASSAAQLFSAISNGIPRIQEEYARVFGHTLSKDTSPYELEHSKKEVFALTQNLADIRGFYNAFGLEVAESERADHIAIEAEFLSYLLFKEIYAKGTLNNEENAEVCRQARHDFLQDHFSWWTPHFARNLQSQPSSFYSHAGLFLQEFLTETNNR